MAWSSQIERMFQRRELPTMGLATPQAGPATRRNAVVPAVPHRWQRQSSPPRIASDDRGSYHAGDPSAHDGGPPADAEGPAEALRHTAPQATQPPQAPPQGRLTALVDELDQLLDVPADTLEAQPSDGLRERVQLLRRLEGMAAAAMAVTVGVLSRTGGVSEDGASSTTAWIAQQTGRSRREASRTTRLSSSLGELPQTTAQLAAGAIGVESADVIVQAARDGRLGTPDEVEARLLPLAADGPEGLRRHVRRLTQQVDGAAMMRDEQRQHQRRRFSLVEQDDGMFKADGLLVPEVGNRFRTLLNAVDERDPAETPSEQRRRPDQRLADALEMVVNMGLDLGPLPTVGGVSRPHISVLIDITTFDADLSDPDDPGRPVGPTDAVWADLPGVETEWAGTLSPQTAVKLCCDAGISRVVMAGTSQVLDVGRETRTWSPPQRRGVNARDRCCRGPGCYRPIGWTQIHHLRWWENDGPTSVDNGLALCPDCHDLVHHGGWHAELDVATAAVTWTSPDRRRTVVTHPRPPA